METSTDAGSIHIRGLTRRFGDVVAVHPFDLDVGPGGITGLIGPNGSGKSTLLRMLMGLVPKDGGAARVDGVELVGDGIGIRRRCSYAPGEIGHYGEMRGDTQLDFLCRGRSEAERRAATELAEAMELPLSKKVHGYSHGMKRQLLLAAALAPRVPIRLLDEPTEGLDPSKRNRVLELLAADAALGTTILLSSHHFGEVDRACQRILFVHGGRILADVRPQDVHARARRILHLTWPESASPDTIGRTLREFGAGEVTPRGRAFVIELEEDDPRPFLGALAQEASIPPPTSIEFGKLSLTELYRDLYGVEGL